MERLGRLGHLIEPVIEPLGFDWKIGVGLLGAFAARGNPMFWNPIVALVSLLFVWNAMASSVARAMCAAVLPRVRPVTPSMPFGSRCPCQHRSWQ